jgi:hypothetical protein
MGVILRQLDSQASRLHADRGIALGIEAYSPSQDLGRDLVLLEGYTGMIKGVLGKIAEQLAQGFRPPEAMTINKPLYLLEALLPASREGVRQSHLTTT